jgi:hypothetical protein
LLASFGELSSSSTTYPKKLAARQKVSLPTLSSHVS